MAISGLSYFEPDLAYRFTNVRPRTSVVVFRKFAKPTNAWTMTQKTWQSIKIEVPLLPVFLTSLPLFIHCTRLHLSLLPAVPHKRECLQIWLFSDFSRVLCFQNRWSNPRNLGILVRLPIHPCVHTMGSVPKTLQSKSTERIVRGGKPTSSALAVLQSDQWASKWVRSNLINLLTRESWPLWSIHLSFRPFLLPLGKSCLTICQDFYTTNNFVVMRMFISN